MSCHFVSLVTIYLFISAEMEEALLCAVQAGTEPAWHVSSQLLQ